VFRISIKKETILTLEGFQEKSVNNLIEAIEKAKKQKIEVFLSSLGIPGV
jgi:DNA ligase (NAD+)